MSDNVPARMTPNGPKVREALLCLIRQADQHDFCLTQYYLLKALFFADRSHLNKYGRPITFDHYYALPDGPVPSLSYEVLKKSPGAWDYTGMDAALWEATPQDGTKVRFHNAARDPSDEILSESDMEELEAAFEHVRHRSFKRIWSETHQDRAYVNAKAKGGTSNNPPMEYVDLFDEPNAKRAQDLLSQAKVHF
ncbi:Panacea domain-containing protein [Novosphingobium rosa]|uniref:Panacea domain-containing protein n=1 Tax=Novosphingobium rosa TaxID=76978 RepID=UPI000AB49737|nr:Panacea domain-containing protein [Novosphingobium rosa]